MQVVGGVVAERLDVKPFHDVQHLERDEALRARRHFVDVVTAVIGRDGLDPVGLVVGEVAHFEQAVAGFHVGDDRAGDRSLVKRVAALLGDHIQRARQPRVCEDVALFHRLAIRQEGRSGVRIGRQCLEAVVPLVGHQLGDRKSVARVGDCGGHRPGQRDGAEARQQLVPAFDDAGHVDGEWPSAGHLREAAPLVLFGRRRVCGAAGRVEAVDFFRFRVVDNREQIAADAVHARLDDREDRRRRDGRVNGVAAVLQHLQPCRRCERLAGRNHAVAADRGRARAAHVAGRAIAGLNLLGGRGGHDQSDSGEH